MAKIPTKSERRNRRIFFDRTMKKAARFAPGGFSFSALRHGGHAGRRATQYQAGFAFEVPIIRVM
ncbi:hypothetical protein [Paraburkholderia youngii]|uniref:Uncharacterized protein n=1 Tax=Paraburkholderia youngii TaxID=2782701 RepID=A0ABX2NM43_9BURK|nr:hypothetical protein [Paraburkholderia youngii]NVI05481.1 hypothetical protein [Paraburkholderia youngii]